MLGIWTQDRRMVGEDESTDIWRAQWGLISSIALNNHNCKSCLFLVHLMTFIFITSSRSLLRRRRWSGTRSGTRRWRKRSSTDSVESPPRTTARTTSPTASTTRSRLTTTASSPRAATRCTSQRATSRCTSTITAKTMQFREKDFSGKVVLMFWLFRKKKLISTSAEDRDFVKLSKGFN